MATDVRAMRPHDLISVVVSESLAASTDGTVKNSRASNASSTVSALFWNFTPRQRTAEFGQSDIVIRTECARNECDEFQLEYNIRRASD